MNYLHHTYMENISLGLQIILHCHFIEFCGVFILLELCMFYTRTANIN